jgi:hypothetical protein
MKGSAAYAASGRATVGCRAESPPDRVEQVRFLHRVVAEPVKLGQRANLRESPFSISSARFQTLAGRYPLRG